MRIENFPVIVVIDSKGNNLYEDGSQRISEDGGRYGMKRILMMVLRNLYLVPYGWIRLCYRAAHVDKYTEEDTYAFSPVD